MGRLALLLSSFLKFSFKGQTVHDWPPTQLILRIDLIQLSVTWCPTMCLCQETKERMICYTKGQELYKKTILRDLKNTMERLNSGKNTCIGALIIKIPKTLSLERYKQSTLQITHPALHAILQRFAKEKKMKEKSLQTQLTKYSLLAAKQQDPQCSQRVQDP